MGGNEERRKMALVAWDKVCVHKKYGGLNIKSCRKWNIAYVGKLPWQVAVKKDVLWVKWVNDVYLKTNGDVRNHTPPRDCSWYWKKNNFP